MKRLECAVCVLTIVATIGLIFVVSISALNMLDSSTDFDPAVQNATLALK